MLKVPSAFFEEWFGPHVGREVLLKGNGFTAREFIEKPEQLMNYVQECAAKRAPVFMSVQPFATRDWPFGLEKLFYDFDSKDDLEKAWKEARFFAESLQKYYQVKPLLCFSGAKGFHIYVFLQRTVQFPTFRTEFVKQVLDLLQRKILKGLHFETLDPNSVGDLKRLSRVPYSVHQETGWTCQPIDLDQNALTLTSIDEYREKGLDTKILEAVCSEVKNEETWRKIRAKWKSPVKFDEKTGVRPCVEKAVSLPLDKGEGHKMRLGIAAEFLRKGFSIDQIVNLFRSQTDFDEEKTRYFVEDASKKGYRPFKCKTIWELGFCLEQCPHRKES